MMIVYPAFVSLDASTGDHQEEEDFYKEEGEENLDPHFNQGKLYSCKPIPLPVKMLPAGLWQAITHAS
jgi:hypothetical protein